MAAKSATAFRTISEVASELALPQHVLRFWETKFRTVRPLKRAGGRRYYRPEDIALLRTIRDLLYNDGYTIKGVQKLLREGGAGGVTSAPSTSASPSSPASGPAAEEAAGPPDMTPAQTIDTRQLLSIVSELEDIRDLLAPSS